MTESNLRIVNYLDVTLKLNGGSLRPCDKPYDIIQYVNKESNQPPNLITAGYIEKVVYQAEGASNQENKNKDHQWNVIWFNLPLVKVS